MNRIAPPNYGNKHDEVIEWLRWLENAIVQHHEGKPIPGAIMRLNEANRHEHTVTFDANAFNWSDAAREDKKRTMQWIPAYEAYLDFVGVLEGWKQWSTQDYQQAQFAIQGAILALSQHNPPKENPVKY